MTARTVLVVEDDDRIRGMLDTVLRDSGYDVIVACNGVEGLSRAEDDVHGIDLLLTDLVMPGIGGLELADRLTEQNPELNVLFMSGYSEDLVSPRLVGPTRTLLEKPFSLIDLLESVRRSLEA